MNLHVSWQVRRRKGQPRAWQAVLIDADEDYAIVWKCEHGHRNSNTGEDRATACAATERDRRERAEDTDE